MKNKIVTAIESRLTTYLNSLSPQVRLVVENEKYSPVIGATYAKGKIFPQVINPSLGSSHKRYYGYYQVNISGPAGVGSGGVTAIAEGIEALFPRGLQGVTAEAGVYIAFNQTPEIRDAILEDNWYTVPIRIPYQVDKF